MEAMYVHAITLPPQVLQMMYAASQELLSFPTLSIPVILVQVDLTFICLKDVVPDLVWLLRSFVIMLNLFCS